MSFLSALNSGSLNSSSANDPALTAKIIALIALNNSSFLSTVENDPVLLSVIQNAFNNWIATNNSTLSTTINDTITANNSSNNTSLLSTVSSLISSNNTSLISTLDGHTNTAIVNNTITNNIDLLTNAPLIAKINSLITASPFPTLAQVMTAGSTASAVSLKMNNQNIQDCNGLFQNTPTVLTINNTGNGGISLGGNIGGTTVVKGSTLKIQTGSASFGGTAGQVLTSDGTFAAWQTAPTSASVTPALAQVLTAGWSAPSNNMEINSLTTKGPNYAGYTLLPSLSASQIGYTFSANFTSGVLINTPASVATVNPAWNIIVTPTAVSAGIYLVFFSYTATAAVATTLSTSINTVSAVRDLTKQVITTGTNLSVNLTVPITLSASGMIYCMAQLTTATNFANLAYSYTRIA